MSCARFPFLLVSTMAAAAAADAPDSSPLQVKPSETPAVVVGPSVPPSAPGAVSARPRVVSPAVAAQLSAAAPRFDPPATVKPVEPAPDLRETDKPRNGIIRLPNYVVREEKPPVFKERELLTPKARLQLALKKHPGLYFGSVWLFRNDGIALAMLAEEERLEQKREFEDLADLMRFGDPALHGTVKREVERAFMRVPDFGR